MIDKLPILHDLAKEKGLEISLQEEDESTTEEISEFSSLISEAQSHIRFIEKKNDELMELRNEVENAIDSKKEGEISNDMNNIISDVQVKQKSLKNIIDNLKDQITKLKENENEKENPETRIKQNLFGALTKKYQDVSIKFQAIENEIKNLIQEKMIRGAEIALGQDLDEKQKNEILNDPKIVQKYYEDKLTGKAHVVLLNAVSDLEERHKEIKTLEKSILQLHNLIMELNQLVLLQGEMIDNIEQNIKQAKEYVQKAEKNVIKAKENYQKSRKKKCIILIIAIVILLIIIIPILIKFI